MGIRINEKSQIVAKKENGEGIILGDYDPETAEELLSDIMRAYAENKRAYIMRGKE